MGDTMQANLTTLMKRLEAATSRLEDIATASFTQNLVTQQHGTPVMNGGPGQAAGSRAAGAAGAASEGSKPSAQPDTPAVAAYQSLIDGPLSAYLSKAKTVGGVVDQQAQAVNQTFQAQLAFLRQSSNCKKPTPSDPAFMALLKDTQSGVSAVQSVQDTDKARKYQNNLKAISEGIAALGWVTVEPTPAPYIKDMKEGAEFYANRVIKECKDADPPQAEVIRSFMKLLDELHAYVKQHHTTGVSWNPKGQDAASVVASANTASSVPPPPQPPSATSTPKVQQQNSPAPSMGSVFAQLSQGEGVTSGLKKVQDDQKTHKNPSLRAEAGAASPAMTSSASSNRPPVGPKPGSAQQAKKPPVLKLEGNKWAVENQENNQQIVIEETAINQIVNVFACKSSVIQIKGKVNAVSLVACQKVSVLMDSAVSSLSITSSPSFTVQITGKVPTITIDATDGGQIYLSENGLDTEVITAKCSALNISLPVKGEEAGIYTEKPIPEQLKTVVKDGRLLTSVVEHAG